jgi:hypothetical protein
MILTGKQIQTCESCSPYECGGVAEPIIFDCSKFNFKDKTAKPRNPRKKRKRTESSDDDEDEASEAEVPTTVRRDMLNQVARPQPLIGRGAGGQLRSPDVAEVLEQQVVALATGLADAVAVTGTDGPDSEDEDDRARNAAAGRTGSGHARRAARRHEGEADEQVVAELLAEAFGDDDDDDGLLALPLRARTQR